MTVRFENGLRVPTRDVVSAAFGVVLAALALSGSAVAQEVPKRPDFTAERMPAITPVPVRATPLTSAPSMVLRLSLNKAEVVNVPGRVRNIVVGNEQVADVHIDAQQPNQVFVLSKAVGSTNVFFLDAKGAIIHQIEVQVTSDHAGVKAALARLMPEEKIDVYVVRNTIFLKGSVSSAGAAAQAVNIVSRFVEAPTDVANMLTIAGSQQVILQVRVAEMARTIRKNLAVNTNFLQVTPTRFGLQFGTTSPSPSLTAFGIGTFFTGTNVLGDPTFQALERQGLAKTLAEPTLTAVSGEAASFLSGGEFPFPTGRDENGNTTYEFREFGIRLNFTPVVIDEGRINLKVSTEVSSIDTTTTITVGNDQIPSVDTKRTETTINLPTGGTLMISGLLQDDVSDTINGFPYLKDIPVLGALFRSTEFQRNETELIITVTAYLARPTGNDAKAALPTDGFEPASDIDIYLLGRLHRKYSKGDSSFWVDPLMGPFGYIMK